MVHAPMAPARAAHAACDVLNAPHPPRACMPRAPDARCGHGSQGSCVSHGCKALDKTSDCANANFHVFGLSSVFRFETQANADCVTDPDSCCSTYCYHGIDGINKKKSAYVCSQFKRSYWDSADRDQCSVRVVHDSCAVRAPASGTRTPWCAAFERRLARAPRCRSSRNRTCVRNALAFARPCTCLAPAGPGGRARGLARCPQRSEPSCMQHACVDPCVRAGAGAPWV